VRAEGVAIRHADFELLIRRLAADVPPEFLEGVEAIEVSPKTLPHPTRREVYTLGECIPLPTETGTGSSGIQSRVVLYHGSFRALAGLGEDFDWRSEAWETLTHELRHHLEWRARAPELEAFDWAAEQNFARAEREPFDPVFYRSGERVAEGVYRIDDDYFLEQILRAPPARVEFAWHGTGYTAPVPAGLTLPAFLTVAGVAEPPPGELMIVLVRRPTLLALLRSRAPVGAEVTAVPA
jgi:hypothetical protein